MNNFLKHISRNRRVLKRNRMIFWEKNKKDLENNIKKIIKTQKLPKGWKFYILISSFLSDDKILPFNYDSWSNVNLIAATEKQGYEIMLFINKARVEFLSLPALVPLVTHEILHVKQAAFNPKKFIMGTLDDKIAKNLEKDVENVTIKLSQKFREENMLESILYCFDMGGWQKAKKMADFLYKKREEIYSGGYNKGMLEKEYLIFLKAKRKKDINIFVNFFN